MERRCHLIVATNKYRDFADSLAGKVMGFSRERAMNTPKQRKQASVARCEAENLSAARDAAEKMADALEQGCLPDIIANGFKTMKSICSATELRKSCGTGYYSEYYLTDEYLDNSMDAERLRAWLKQGESPETEAQKQERANKFRLEQLLSELRGSDIDGFFPTPDPVIDDMLKGISLDGSMVLEPSAGIGSIADRAKAEGANVICFEVNRRLCEVLNLKGHTYIHDDFMRCEVVQEFTHVLMNPPYENDLAPQHVRHAFEFLIPTGELVAVMPQTAVHYQDSARKVRREFAEWLSDKTHSYKLLPEGAFKSSFNPTGVNTCLLWIRK
jgi:hypothetical protein